MGIARRKRRSRLRFDPANFPSLDSRNHRVTSDPIEEQNCIAFAAGDDIHSWWPVQGFPKSLPPPYFWPKSCPLEETVEAFVKAYEAVGFELCPMGEDPSLEVGIEKLAIYAKNVDGKLEPTHAAIQSAQRNGLWKSKMGDDEDIEHMLHVLVGPLYGDVILYMKRTNAKKRAATTMLKKRGLASH